MERIPYMVLWELKNAAGIHEMIVTCLHLGFVQCYRVFFSVECGDSEFSVECGASLPLYRSARVETFRVEINYAIYRLFTLYTCLTLLQSRRVERIHCHFYSFFSHLIHGRMKIYSALQCRVKIRLNNILQSTCRDKPHTFDIICTYAYNCY